MEFQKVIETRRSIRSYDKDRKVDRATVESIINASILAPSWKNSQTARYYCIMTEELLDTFKKECLPEFNARSVANAPVLIVSTFVTKRSGFERDGSPSNELGDGWGIYDLGLHDEILMLKAADMGLDTLVLGIRNVDRIREMLGIDEGEQIVSVIALGYRTADAAMPKRKALEDVAKFF